MAFSVEHSELFVTGFGERHWIQFVMDSDLNLTWTVSDSWISSVTYSYSAGGGSAYVECRVNDTGSDRTGYITFVNGYDSSDTVTVTVYQDADTDEVYIVPKSDVFIPTSGGSAIRTLSYIGDPIDNNDSTGWLELHRYTYGNNYINDWSSKTINVKVGTEVVSKYWDYYRTSVTNSSSGQTYGSYLGNVSGFIGQNVYLIVACVQVDQTSYSLLRNGHSDYPISTYLSTSEFGSSATKTLSQTENPQLIATLCRHTGTSGRSYTENYLYPLKWLCGTAGRDCKWDVYFLKVIDITLLGLENIITSASGGIEYLGIKPFTALNQTFGKQTFTATAGGPRTGIVEFRGNYGNDVTFVRQGNGSMSASPSLVDFNAQGGSAIVTLSCSTAIATEVRPSSATSWLSTNFRSYPSEGSAEYNVICSSNASTSSREGYLIYTGSQDSIAVPVNQGGYSPVNLVVIPATANVNSDAHTESVSVSGATSNTSAAVSYDSGSGSGWVGCSQDAVDPEDWTVVIASNEARQPRYATVTFEEGQSTGTYRITQTANPGPTLTVSPSSANFSGGGGDETLSVIYNTYINSFISSGSDWLTLTKTYDSNEQATFVLSAASNQTSVARSGAITFSDSVSGYLFNVTQASGTPYPFSVSPSTLSFGSGSDSGVVTVDYGGQGSVLVTNSADWLTVDVKDYPDGQGGARVRYDVDAVPNTSTVARTATVEFTGLLGSGETVVTQDAGLPTIAVNPSSLSYSSSGGVSSVSVLWRSGTTPLVTYSWNGGPEDWITAQYAGPGGLDWYETEFIAAANYGSARTATIRYYNETGYADVSVAQDGSSSPNPYSLTVDQSSLVFGSSGGSETVHHTVTAPDLSSVAVTISNPAWMSRTEVDASTNTFTAVSNPNNTLRTGVITYVLQEAEYPYTPLDTKDIQVSQAAGGVTGFNITPSVINFDWRGQTNNDRITVTFPSGTTPNVTYSLTYNQGSGWIDRINGMLSSSEYRYNVILTSTSSSYPGWKVNDSYLARSATLEFSVNGSVIGQVTIIQEGCPTSSLTATPDRVVFPYAGGSETLFVTSGVTITDSIPSGSGWISCNRILTGDTYSAYIIQASSNSGQERRGIVNFRAGTNDLPVSVTQGSPISPDISVTPNPVTIGRTGGSRTLTVTYVAPTSDVSVVYNIPSGSAWMSLSGTGNTYTLTVDANTGAARTGSIVFNLTAGGVVLDVETVTVSQADGYEPIVVSNDYVRFGFRSGSYVISFDNVPGSGLSWQNVPGWASVSYNSVDDTATITVTANNSNSPRNGVIRFYVTGVPSNFVNVTVYQQGQGADEYKSIWVDEYFDFPDAVTGQSYPYGLEIYTDDDYPVGDYSGIAVADMQLPQNLRIPSINIARLTDDYIKTGNKISTVSGWSRIPGKMTVEVYHYYPPTPARPTGYSVMIDSFKYWNDWSGVVRSYSDTCILNDPINFKGCEGMYIPLSVFCNDGTSFNVRQVNINGSSSTTSLGNPSYDFSYRMMNFPGAKTVEFKMGNNTEFTYDMTHCGSCYFVYRNRFGGWDSFLAEGNIEAFEDYSRLNYTYSPKVVENMIPDGYNGRWDNKYTDSVDISTSWTVTTGWLTDEEAHRLVYHLLSSPAVKVHLTSDNPAGYTYGWFGVRLTDTKAEYKKFRNGRRLVNYTISFEKAYIDNVKN